MSEEKLVPSLGEWTNEPPIVSGYYLMRVPDLSQIFIVSHWIESRCTGLLGSWSAEIRVRLDEFHQKDDSPFLDRAKLLERGVEFMLLTRSGGPFMPEQYKWYLRMKKLRLQEKRKKLLAEISQIDEEIRYMDFRISNTKIVEGKIRKEKKA